MRTFESGADRDDDADKIDPEGALSPLVLEAFANYMHKHRTRRDGSTRTADNWQRGMGADVFAKSLWRHFLSWWRAHREGAFDEEAAMGMFFNLQGYIHEGLKAQKKEKPGEKPTVYRNADGTVGVHDPSLR